jgi:hypothetical protein
MMQSETAKPAQWTAGKPISLRKFAGLQMYSLDLKG